MEDIGKKFEKVSEKYFKPVGNCWSIISEVNGLFKIENHETEQHAFIDFTSEEGRHSAFKLMKNIGFNEIQRGKIWSEVKRIEKKEQEIKKTNPGSSSLDDLYMSINDSTNWLKVADQFVQRYGMYYDNSKLWWFWDKKEYCWNIVDETEIMNVVDNALQNNPQTVQSKIKQQILEALKRRSRLNKPKEPKKTWLQFKDKIIDLETGETFPSSPEYFFTNPIPHSIGETEETPEMDKLFKEWVKQNDTDQDFDKLYEILAFGLAPTYFIHRIIVLVGAGSNGKSKYLDMIKKFIGKRNCSTTDLELLANRFESSGMYKKLVCLMGETNFNKLEKTNKIKRLTGEDLIRYEFKGKDAFQDTNYAKIMIATNALPVTSDKTWGFYRRWLVIDFPNKFTEEEDVLKRIPDVEYNNLAKKTVRILKELMRSRKFTNEGTEQEREQRYEEKSNPINTFIKENFVKDQDGKYPFYLFYEEYVKFLTERGYRIQSRKEVGQIIREDGFEIEKENVKKADGKDTTWNFIKGIRIRGSIEKS